MSAIANIAALVRACPVDWLDAKYGATHEPSDIANELYAAIRTEVLREAVVDQRCALARGVPAEAPSIGRYLVSLIDPDAREKATAPAATATPELLLRADVVAWLTKKAREQRARGPHFVREADVISALASKVERGAIRPDNLRMLPADFFEPGRTYTEPGDTTDWKFRCDSITTHPASGERTALGWRHFRGKWEPCAYDEDEYEIHQIADALATETEGRG